MWSDIAAKVLAHVDHELASRKAIKRQSRHWSETEFYQYFEGLEDELWDDQTYQDAVEAGVAAGPDPEALDVDALRAIVAEWAKHLKPYGADVPKRLAAQIAAVLNQLEIEHATPESTGVPAEAAPAETLLKAFAERLDGLETSVTRYAKPIWGAGQQGYGESLGVSGVLLDWDLEDGGDHCNDCPAIADGSPYAVDDLPSWPTDGSTQCRDNCLCEIKADVQTYHAAFPSAEPE